jgi:hypothetical protein
VITACYLVIAYLSGVRPGVKRAELHLMQHSAGRENGVFAVQQGMRWTIPWLCEKPDQTTCTRPMSPQQ